MRTLKWLFFNVCLFSSSLGVASSPPPSAPLESPPLSTFKILIYKAGRKLEVFGGEKKIHEFKVVLGPNPEGNKQRQGDGKTPEGVYYVRVKNARSQFYLSLGLSYPERRDAKRALAEKRITQAQHDKIIGAHDKKKKPPSNTPLGGEIFIHGGGASSGGDWTAGCVALDNPDMKLLFEKIPPGTEVEILP